ncbi:putative serine/threonine-protein kinase ifkC [Porphyridium purpureum]|uniref:non-specific serine/threonine protein kinase n=1 Tax=Porphyridium purpureum TaxID=35688 RepID=A0A5J4Z1A0_PORPP|nr:putative serine/threonine-protein kinase ifkC [Porphyridium purpureum]|eukprot:POR2875..scf208_2
MSWQPVLVCTRHINLQSHGRSITALAPTFSCTSACWDCQTACPNLRFKGSSLLANDETRSTGTKDNVPMEKQREHVKQQICTPCLRVPKDTSIHEPMQNASAPFRNLNQDERRFTDPDARRSPGGTVNTERGGTVKSHKNADGGGGGGGGGAHSHHHRHAHATQHGAGKRYTVVFELVVNPDSEQEVQNPRKFPEAHQQSTHVSLLLTFRLPPDYPAKAPCKISASRRRNPSTNAFFGPTEAKVAEIRRMAADEAKKYVGVGVCVYDVVNVVREELVKINRPELDLREEMIQRQAEMQRHEQHRLQKKRTVQQAQAEQHLKREKQRASEMERMRKLEALLTNARNARKREVSERLASLPTAPSLGHSQSPPGFGLQEKRKENDHDPLQELSADDPALLLRVRADSLNKARKPDRQAKVDGTIQREPLIQAMQRQNERELNDSEDDRFSLREEDIVFDEDPSKTSRMSWSSSSSGSSTSTSTSRSNKGTKQGMSISRTSEHERDKSGTDSDADWSSASSDDDKDTTIDSDNVSSGRNVQLKGSGSASALTQPKPILHSHLRHTRAGSGSRNSLRRNVSSIATDEQDDDEKDELGSITFSDREFDQSRTSRLSTSLNDGDFLDHTMLNSLGAANFGISIESRARQALFFRQLLRAVLNMLRLGPGTLNQNQNRRIGVVAEESGLVSSPTKVAAALASILPPNVLSTSDVGKIFDPADSTRFRKEFALEISAAHASGGSIAKFWSVMLAGGSLDHGGGGIGHANASGTSHATSNHQNNRHDRRYRDTVSRALRAAANHNGRRKNSHEYNQMRRSASLATSFQISSRFKDDFLVLQKLGAGGFGSVVKARNRLDGRVYAIKRIPLTEAELNDRTILREVMTLARLTHPNIVRYHQAWLERLDEAELEHDLSNDHSTRGSSSDLTAQAQASPIIAKLFIQMEFCTSTLREFIDTVDDTGMDLWSVFRQIVEGLDNIHSRGIVHRDLKPTNIFFSESGAIKIGDFGLASIRSMEGEDEGADEPSKEAASLADKSAADHDHQKGEEVRPSNAPAEVKEDRSGDAEHHVPSHSHAKGKDRSGVLPWSQHDQTTDVGTFYYRAPEIESIVLRSGAGWGEREDGTGVNVATHVLAPAASSGTRRTARYSNKVDLYSLGVIAWELWHGPCSTEHERYQQLMTLRATALPPDELFREALPQQTRLINALMSPDPENRPSASELLTSDVYMPPRIEDDYFRDIIRQLALPGNTLRKKVLEALFSSGIGSATNVSRRMPAGSSYGGSGVSALSLASSGQLQPATLSMSDLLPQRPRLLFGCVQDRSIFQLGDLKEALVGVFVSVATQYGAHALSAPLVTPVESSAAYVSTCDGPDEASASGTGSNALEGISEYNANIQVPFLTESGEALSLRRDFRSYLARMVADGVASPVKCYQVGDAWFPSIRPSSLHQHHNQQQEPERGVAAGKQIYAPSQYGQGREVALSSSPDVTGFMLGVRGVFDLTEKSGRAGAPTADVGSTHRPSGAVFRAHATADLDFVAPNPWAPHAAEAIKAALDFSSSVLTLPHLSAGAGVGMGIGTGSSFGMNARPRFSLRLGHTRITQQVLQFCGLPAQLHAHIGGILSQTPFFGWAVTKRALLESQRISKSCVETLAPFAVLRGTPKTVIKGLVNLMQHGKGSRSGHGSSDVVASDALPATAAYLRESLEPELEGIEKGMRRPDTSKQRGNRGGGMAAATAAVQRSSKTDSKKISRALAEPLEELCACLLLLEDMNVSTEDIILDAIMCPTSCSNSRPPLPNATASSSLALGSSGSGGNAAALYDRDSNLYVERMRYPSGSYTLGSSQTSEVSGAPGSSAGDSFVRSMHPVDSASAFTAWSGCIFELVMKLGGKSAAAASTSTIASIAAASSTPASVVSGHGFGSVAGEWSVGPMPNLEDQAGFREYTEQRLQTHQKHHGHSAASFRPVLPPIVEVVARGGSWNRMVHVQQNMTQASRTNLTQRNECDTYGVTFDLEKLVSVISVAHALSVSLSGLGNMSDGFGLTQSTGSVFVYGQSRAASDEGDMSKDQRSVLGLVAELRANGVRAEYLCKSNATVSEQLDAAGRVGAIWLVDVSGQPRFRVKPLHGPRKSETEFGSRDELFRFLLQMSK